MQYTSNPQNAANRKPLQALPLNPTTTTHDHYMQHDEYKQSSSMHIDNPCNENMDPSHMDNIRTEVKSAINNDETSIRAMHSEFNPLNNAQIQNNNLYLRRQNKSNNSICNGANHDDSSMHQTTMPPLRIELCGTNSALCSANSFITNNDNVLLSSASSIHSASVGNAYQSQTASFSCDSTHSAHDTNHNPPKKGSKKKKSNSLFTKITNLMTNRRSTHASNHETDRMNQDEDEEEMQGGRNEEQHGTFTPSTGNTPRVNTVITPMTDPKQYTKESITQRIGKDTFATDYLNELFIEESKYNALAWYNVTASYNADTNKKLRQKAVDWICRIGINWELQRSSIYSAIYYFDKLCSSQDVNIYHLQMVAASCLLIAIKFNEREERVPSLYKLSKACHKQYTPSSFKSMEIKLLNLLDFKLKTVLAIDFVSYWIDIGCIFEDDTLDDHRNLHLHKQSNVYLEKFAIFFLDISCQNYTFWSYLPSILAFAVIVASRRALRIEPYFNTKLSAKCRYQPADITECFDKLWNEYHVKFPKDAKSAEILQPHSLRKCVMEID